MVLMALGSGVGEFCISIAFKIRYVDYSEQNFIIFV